MQTLHSLYNLMPLEAWLTLVGGPVASTILAKLKKWLQVVKEPVVIVLLLTVSFLEGLGALAVQHFTQDPGTLLPYMGIISASAVTFYHLFAKPAVQLVQDAKAQREGQADPTLGGFTPVDPAADTLASDPSFSAQ